MENMTLLDCAWNEALAREVPNGKFLCTAAVAAAVTVAVVDVVVFVVTVEIAVVAEQQ